MKTVFICLALWAIGWVVMRPFLAVSHPPGVLAPTDPVQGPLLEGAPAIRLESWTLTPLATYSIHARVLASKAYRSDATSEISPLDLLLGWGPMSDSLVLGEIHFRQSHRFGYWEHGPDAPLSTSEITRHAANTHLIPANRIVKDRLAALRVGSVVQLRGKLVEATRVDRDAPPWRSSLSRTDSGAGACEILYVESVAGR